MNTLFRLITIIIPIVLLSGCLYPQSELTENQVPNEEQLRIVEEAVLKYRDDKNGLVPIKTKPSDVPLYEKYLIDFTVLKEQQYIYSIPSSAYENGGYYQYIIITPEDNPRVKLIDLRVTEKLREVNMKLDIYRSKNLYPPFGEQVDPGIFRLNFEKIGYKEEPYVVSPFSKQNLPILMTTDGELIVDYRIDYQLALEQYPHSFKDGDNIAPILEDNYPFVPAYSVSYTLEDDVPVFVLD